MCTLFAVFYIPQNTYARDQEVRNGQEIKYTIIKPFSLRIAIFDALLCVYTAHGALGFGFWQRAGGQGENKK